MREVRWTVATSNSSLERHEECISKTSRQACYESVWPLVFDEVHNLSHDKMGSMNQQHSLLR